MSYQSPNDMFYLLTHTHTPKHTPTSKHTHTLTLVCRTHLFYHTFVMTIAVFRMTCHFAFLWKYHTHTPKHTHTHTRTRTHTHTLQKLSADEGCHVVWGEVLAWPTSPVAGQSVLCCKATIFEDGVGDMAVVFAHVLCVSCV